MKLIGLTGFAQSGKDTAASFLIERGWKRLAFADKVREAALAIDPWVDFHHTDVPIYLSELVGDIGWDAAKQYYEVRRLLQKIGTEAGREIHGPSCWTDIIHDAIIDCGEWNYEIHQFDLTTSVVITDVRFPEEVEMVRDFGGTIVRINKPGVGPVNNHQSDTILDSITPDAVIDNDGTLEDLKRKIIAYAYDEVPV